MSGMHKLTRKITKYMYLGGIRKRLDDGAKGMTFYFLCLKQQRTRRHLDGRIVNDCNSGSEQADKSIVSRMQRMTSRQAVEKEINIQAFPRARRLALWTNFSAHGADSVTNRSWK